MSDLCELTANCEALCMDLLVVSIVDWMFVSPQNANVETLTSNMMVLDNGALQGN